MDRYRGGRNGRRQSLIDPIKISDFPIASSARDQNIRPVMSGREFAREFVQREIQTLACELGLIDRVQKEPGWRARPDPGFELLVILVGEDVLEASISDHLYRAKEGECAVPSQTFDLFFELACLAAAGFSQNDDARNFEEFGPGFRPGHLTPPGLNEVGRDLLVPVDRGEDPINGTIDAHLKTPGRSMPTARPELFRIIDNQRHPVLEKRSPSSG
ncbi:hypothetical protein [Brevundimonas variabilis]|uniref:Uncharacterized protein n=1 Tax=Brevundimonas variabilis TaxID=74312 RepID=A0A7W9CJA1_9CAUL|nr:hypothetical protein [Brevundimonas variabilis]MBB5746581.1 hypothetical protein [Brevundimonas variabilis]